MTPLPSSRAPALLTRRPEFDDPARDAPRSLVDRVSRLLNAAFACCFAFSMIVAAFGGFRAVARPPLSADPAQSADVVAAVRSEHAGVISRLLVKDGGPVSRGDVLYVVATPAADVDANEAAELLALRARLVAERDGKSSMTPTVRDVSLPAKYMGPTALAEQQALLDARRQSWGIQKQRLRERIVQIGKEIEAVEAQQRAKEKELELIRQELRHVEDLRRRQLANVVRLIGMQREVARYEGELGALLAHVARVRGHGKEIELQIAELDQRIVTDAHDEIRNIDAKLAAIRREGDGERSFDVAAPASGIVRLDPSIHVGAQIAIGQPTVTILGPPPERRLASVARDRS